MQEQCTESKQDEDRQNEIEGRARRLMASAVYKKQRARKEKTAGFTGIEEERRGGKKNEIKEKEDSVAI